MKFSQEIMELFDQYIAGELSDDKRIAFDQRLEDEPDFAKLFAKYITIFQAFRELGKEQRQEELKGLYVKDKTKTKRPISMRFIAIAASILLLFALGLWWLMPRSYTAEQLYAQYAVHESLKVSTMGDTELLLAKAERAFNTKDYQTALPLLNEYLAQKLDDLDVLLAKGICELETGAYGLAVKSFQDISQSDARVNKGPWYLALTYLRMGELVRCKRELKNIIQKGEYGGKEARELLGKME